MLALWANLGATFVQLRRSAIPACNNTTTGPLPLQCSSMSCVRPRLTEIGSVSDTPPFWHRDLTRPVKDPYPNGRDSGGSLARVNGHRAERYAQAITEHQQTTGEGMQLSVRAADR